MDATVNGTGALAMSRGEAARRLAVCLRTVDELLAKRELKSFRIRGRRMISEAALQAFVRRQEKAG